METLLECHQSESGSFLNEVMDFSIDFESFWE